MNKAVFFLMVWITTFGCTWENEESLYPELCDTISVSFAVDIVPILTNNCHSCHSNINAPDIADGIAFEDYEDVAAGADFIVGAINHFDDFLQMPEDQDKLDACLINTFEAWVNQGSLEN